MTTPFALRRCAHTLAAVAAWLSLSHPGLAQPARIPWSLQDGNNDLVAFRGLVNHDDTGAKSGPLLYPAPNLGSLFAAIITHGVIVESQKSAEKQRLQEKADAVLDPYRAVLATFRRRELMESALRQITPASPSLKQPSDAADGWTLKNDPVFTVTQDRQALVLDNAVVAYAPGGAHKPAYAVVVRVVSRPRAEAELDAFWSAEGGAEIKAEASSMLAHSLQLAAAESAGAPESERPFRSVRYLEGSTERIERAQIIHRFCERQVLRNLRGWVISVPVKEDDPSCLTALASWK